MACTSLHSKYSNYHYCIVRDCRNTSVKTPGKLWIRVPSEIKMRNTWLQLAKKNPGSYSPDTIIYFCEDHFHLENDMENYMRYKIMGSVKRIRMKPDCIPSRFDCQTDRKRKLPTPTPDELQHDSKKTAVMPISEEETFSMEVLTSDAQRTEQDPLCTEGLERCRFCAEFNKDFVEITGDKPYLNNNKTALTLNNDSVELAFIDTLPKTVCRDCDAQLQDMYDFIKQVKVAQELMINVTDETKNVETLIVKTERDSPTPEDDSKDGIIESITVTETEFVKPVTNKRKCDITMKQKKRKVSKDSELISDIKEETIDIDEHPLDRKTASEISDTGTDDKPSELDLATRALVNVMAGDDGLS